MVRWVVALSGLAGLSARQQVGLQSCPFCGRGEERGKIVGACKESTCQGSGKVSHSLEVASSEMGYDMIAHSEAPPCACLV
jgi:hypothetical protein